MIPPRAMGPLLPDEAPEPRPGPRDATWRWWEAFVVFLISIGVLAVVGGPLLSLLPEGNWQEIAAGLFLQATTIATVLLWLRALHRRSMGALGWPRRPVVEVAVGFGLGLGTFLVAAQVTSPLIESLLRSVAGRRPPDPQQIPEHLTNVQAVVTGVMVLVMAPVSEELLFRGMLFGSLRARHSRWFAVLVSAVVFSAAHAQGDLLQYAYLALTLLSAGIAFALIYDWRGNILTSMAAHAGFNTLGYLYLIRRR